jgi:hypothetical protein
MSSKNRESPQLSKRLARERDTMAAMIEVYCRGLHRSRAEPCPECCELLAYAERRIARCPFHDDKPPCAKCPIHCYQPRIREQIKAVMRYAGPRMILRHPVFALRHWLDGRREAPAHPKADKQRRAGGA